METIEELIEVKKTKIGNDEVNSVSARELYLQLGFSDANFTTWCKKNLLDDFEENFDYIQLFLEKKSSSHGKGGKEKVDYIITLDVAKHLAMLSKTPVGKKVRKYFINVEKVAKNILGDEKLKLEIKKLENEIELEYIEKKIQIAQRLQSMGANFDPVALAKGEFVTKLPQDIGTVLTEAMSDIRVGIRTYSATYLLAENGIDILTRDFNSALMLAGVLEEYKYNGKTYKRFVNKYNWYGYNQDASSIRTNPVLVKYYEDRFMDLVQMLRNDGYID